jgi:hypothetical protein
MDNIITDPRFGGYVATGLGLAFIGSVLASSESFTSGIENFGNEVRRENFYNGNKSANGTQSNGIYGALDGSKPRGQQDVSLKNSGDQLLAYQMYQQAVNAATPTKQQLDSIGGQAQEQPVSEKTAPYNILNGNRQASEYQAVNMGNERAQSISACAQNAPTFVATSLLPKPSIPGQKSWDINAPANILANQNFLAATQQVGVDTVLGSLRNASYDIRNNIPNPINIVSPWMNTTITPDLEKRPLDCFIPTGDSLYSCGPSGCNTNGTFVGK